MRRLTYDEVWEIMYALQDRVERLDSEIRQMDVRDHDMIESVTSQRDRVDRMRSRINDFVYREEVSR